jgi:hypothetical protein
MRDRWGVQGERDLIVMGMTKLDRGDKILK